MAKNSEITSGATSGVASLIFWDGYGLDQTGTGVFVHARELAHSLKTEGVFPTIIGNPQACNHFTDLPTIELPTPNFIADALESKCIAPMRVQSRLRQDMRTQKQAYILHGLSNINLPWLSWKQKNSPHSQHARYVLTVHDVIPLLSPQDVSKAYFYQFSLAMPFAVKLAHRIVCVSEWTRKTLVERFPACASKVRVIRNGCLLQSETLKLQDNMEARAFPPSDHGLRLLSIGRDESYKNLDLLVQLLDKSGQTLDIDLVTNASGKQRLSNLGAKYIHRGNLRVHCGISDGQLQSLHKNAAVYVHPSRYEGFCLPAATSLSCGVPVVYQAGSAIEELVGDSLGQSLTEAASPEAWLEAILAASRLPGTQVFQTALRNYRASAPSWKDSGKALKSLYTELITA